MAGSHVVRYVRTPAEPALAGGDFAREASLAVTMDKVNVLLQGALALELRLALNLWALEQLHLGPVLLGGHLPSRVRAFVLHHLHLLLVNVLFAVLAVVDPKTDQGVEDLPTLVTGELVTEASLLVQLQLCHGVVHLSTSATVKRVGRHTLDIVDPLSSLSTMDTLLLRSSFQLCHLIRSFELGIDYVAILEMVGQDLHTREHVVAIGARILHHFFSPWSVGLDSTSFPDRPGRKEMVGQDLHTRE